VFPYHKQAEGILEAVQWTERGAGRTVPAVRQHGDAEQYAQNQGADKNENEEEIRGRRDMIRFSIGDDFFLTQFYSFLLAVL
jgi:hypothetical protein